jgi:hypothetical protein
MLKDGEVVEVNDSYGARLIEQGKAVLSPKKKSEKDGKKQTESNEKGE